MLWQGGEIMREKRVLDMLNRIRENGYATTQSLSEEFHISLSTVRRDLAGLAHANLITYSRNMAVPVSERATDGPLNFRASINTQAKRALAHEAVRLVKNGSTVFLDSSSTVLPMVSMLQSISDLTIVTNGLHVVPRMVSSRLTVHVVGGEMSQMSYGFYGPLTENAIRQFNFDMAFFSPVGISPQNLAVETTMDAASVRRTAMEQAACSVLLFDQSKIGVSRSYNFAHLDEFQYLITNDASHDFDTPAQLRRVRT